MLTVASRSLVPMFRRISNRATFSSMNTARFCSAISGWHARCNRKRLQRQTRMEIRTREGRRIVSCEAQACMLSFEPVAARAQLLSLCIRCCADMSPELFYSDGIHSFASDIYAFGAVLYE